MEILREQHNTKIQARKTDCDVQYFVWLNQPAVFTRIVNKKKRCAYHALARVPVQERLAAEHAGEPFFV